MFNTNDELYVNEHYKFGDKEKELLEFEKHVRNVKEAQKALKEKHGHGKFQRVFHTKGHACLAGKLTLLEDRSEITRHGVFSAHGKGAYNVLVRFSSGVGFDQHDLNPDVRGLALKIFGVSDGLPDTPSTPVDEPQCRRGRTDGAHALWRLMHERSSRPVRSSTYVCPTAAAIGPSLNMRARNSGEEMEHWLQESMARPTYNRSLFERTERIFSGVALCHTA
jgi:hypothetical protein